MLTVHGAKGLEAPVVILADADLRAGAATDRLIWLEDERLPLWRVGGKAAATRSASRRTRPPACASCEEQRRLLYVA